MKKYSILTVFVAVILLLATLTGCAGYTLPAEAEKVAVGYYEYLVMRQDQTGVAPYCAYDRMALLNELYEEKASANNQTVEEYIADTAKTRGYENVTTLDEFLKALSDDYVEKTKEQYGEGYFTATAKVVEAEKATEEYIKDIYDTLVDRYKKNNIDFTQYLPYDSISEGAVVTLSTSESGGNVADVLVVKANGEWGYLN